VHAPAHARRSGRHRHQGPDGAAPLSVNLYVNFAYDSAELTSDARITLDRLGYALVDDRLKSFNFMIEGTPTPRGATSITRSCRSAEPRASGNISWRSSASTPPG